MLYLDSLGWEVMSSGFDDVFAYVEALGEVFW